MRGEVAADEIRALLGARISSDRGPPRPPAPLGAPDPIRAHQPRDAVTADLLALAAQLAPHPRIPVALEVLLVHVTDPGGQPLVLERARRALARGSLVVRGRRHAQDAADRLDAEAFAMLIDERAHLGRSASR